MITGYTAGTRHAPHVHLDVAGGGTAPERIEFMIDTGFSEFLTLPPHLVRTLEFEPLEVDRLVLADGTAIDVSVYKATVSWDGDRYSVPVATVESTPLVGCAMMVDYEIRVEFSAGGRVELRRRARVADMGD